MCGIVGLFHYGTDQPIDPNLLVKMRDTMQHRGPDGGGLWCSADCYVGLGHRRLSIIDLSDTANQPMSNEDDTLWIVFNGEIYNHAAIRAELEAAGRHQWKTDHSDTEMILHAFEEWGIECIHRFRGMFAIALWDVRQQQLWLIRDRIGVKPLYYTFSDGRLAFASEIKALLQLPGIKRAVHEEALYHYLSFLTTPAPQTLFEGIYKLPPATWLRVNADGTTHQERYWDVWDHTLDLSKASEAEITERLLAELRTAVQLRKISDVPVGVFLSGGIDSSTNTALFSEGEGHPVKTFSIGYEGEYQSYQNELHFARLMADKVGANYHERLLNLDDLINFLPLMVHLQDEPIADPVCVPVYYVSKLARDNGVTVSQVGEGADELFWGYESWATMLRRQSQFGNPFIPNGMRHLAMWGARQTGRDFSYTYELVRRTSVGQPIFWGGAEAFFETQKQHLLSPRMRQQLGGLTSWEALRRIHERFMDKAWEKSPLQWMSYLDLNYRLPELLLMRVDKMSMGVSLECRVPFLDHQFVELAMSIPQATKTTDHVSKYVLKKAVRGLIPDQLIDRRKQGFGVPVHEWFFDRLGDQMRRDLNDFCDQTDYLDKAAVNQVLDQGQGVLTWYLFNLALWWKTYIQ
ncbi:MAG: asparagine synthase (glutamine-hydrolyzing) [Anaerolineales bacterium]|nr:asparagine synthase (glutamine-hydrolyzing) [Anaerolineales bacterium]